MPTLALTVTSPNAGYAMTSHPLRVTLTGAANEATVLRADYTNEDGYTETGAGSPLQTGSSALLVRDSVNIFRGRVRSRSYRNDGDTESHSFEAHCAIGDLARAACYINSSHLGTIRSDTIQFTDISLVPLTVGASAATDLYYYPDPDVSTTAYYPITSSPRTINTTITCTDSATTIVTSSLTDELFPREGILKSGTEYIAYSGYGYNTSSVACVFYVVANGRGALSSTAAAHSGVGADLIYYKRIDPASTITVKDGATTLTEGTDYTVNYEEGRMELVAAPSGAVTATYKVFDELAADALLLGGDATYGVLDLIITGGWANGAPQFDGASDRPTYHISTSTGPKIDDVRIPYFKLTTPVTARQAIDELITQYQRASVLAGCERRPLLIWLDHDNNKLYIAPLYTNTSYVAVSQKYIQKHKAVRYDYDSSQVYTDAVVSYRASNDPDTGAAVHIKTTSASVTDISGYYDTDTYRKFRANGAAQPLVFCADAGSVSRGIAASVGRDAIYNSVDSQEVRTYDFDDVRDFYWIGDVINFADGWRGQVIGATYNWDGNSETMTLQAVAV